MARPFNGNVKDWVRNKAKTRASDSEIRTHRLKLSQRGNATWNSRDLSETGPELIRINKSRSHNCAVAKVEGGTLKAVISLTSMPITGLEGNNRFIAIPGPDDLNNVLMRLDVSELNQTCTVAQAYPLSPVHFRTRSEDIFKYNGSLYEGTFSVPYTITGAATEPCEPLGFGTDDIPVEIYGNIEGRCIFKMDHGI